MSRRNIRYMTIEDLENSSSEELRVIGSSSIILCLVEKRHDRKRNKVRSGHPAKADLHRTSGSDAVIFEKASGAENLSRSGRKPDR